MLGYSVGIVILRRFLPGAKKPAVAPLVDLREEEEANLS